MIKIFLLSSARSGRFFIIDNPLKSLVKHKKLHHGYVGPRMQRGGDVYVIDEIGGEKSYTCRKIRKTKNNEGTKGKSKPETESETEIQPSEPEGIRF